MTRRDWWIGVVVLALAVLAHALVPRYTFEIRDGRAAGVAIYRVDSMERGG